MTTTETDAPETMTATEIHELPTGTTVLVATDDRKHPFRAEVVDQSEHGTTLQAKRHELCVVYRADGSISHLARFSLGFGMPSTCKANSIVLAQ